MPRDRTAPAALAHRLAVLAALASPAAAGPPITLHVDDDAPDGGDGGAWETAFRDLQDALDAARLLQQDVDIQIAGGFYRPDRATGNRSASFDLASLDVPPCMPPGLDAAEFPETLSVCSGIRLTITGGFAGLSLPGDPGVHDPDAYPTTLSGDLDADDALPAGTRDDNSFTVVRILPVRFDIVTLNHLSISGGNAVGPEGSERFGGGLFADSDIPAPIFLRNCVFRDNHAQADGGAVHARGMPLRVVDCAMLANSAGNAGGAIDWTSPYANGADVSILRTTLADNDASIGGALHTVNGVIDIRDSAFRSNTGAYGGAINCSNPEFAYLLGTTIDRNLSPNGGAGLRVSNASHFVALACQVTGNRVVNPGKEGGGGYLHRSRAEFVSCVFAGNSASKSGHALFLSQSRGSSKLINCTLTWNGSYAADPGAALISAEMSDGSLEIRNSILWNNIMDEEATLVSAGLSGGSGVIVDHCLAEGGRDGFRPRADGPSPFFFGAMVGDADPLFLDWDGPDDDILTFGDNDYSPAPNSPAIDHGRDDVLLSNPYPSIDAVGSDRIVNLAQYPGSSFYDVDIGAIEAPIDTPNPCPADLDHDGANTYSDILVFMTAFVAGRIEADLYRDAAFNILDVLEFLDAFAAGCP